MTSHSAAAKLASMDSGDAIGMVISLDDLPHTDRFHEWVGAEHGEVSFSIILIHCAPGEGPKLHRHPYAEVFVVEQGQATFQLGDRQLIVPSGHVVVGPPNTPHGFANSGPGELQLVSIHDASRFDTGWLVGPDPDWSSPAPPADATSP